ARALNTAEQVADEVLRVDALAAAGDRRLRVIGLTWKDEAAAQAALLLEALTDAGFDNVVPVRLLEAVETLALAIAPVIGYEQTAVCILDHEWATVVMVDIQDGQTQTAVKHVRGGFDGLTSWLSGMFERPTGWRPGGVGVVSAGNDVDGFSWQLEKTLPVPVFAQTLAQVTIARGAALAAARSTEFTDDRLVGHVGDPAAAPEARPRKVSYAGAGTALAGGARPGKGGGACPPATDRRGRRALRRAAARGSAARAAVEGARRRTGPGVGRRGGAGRGVPRAGS